MTPGPVPDGSEASWRNGVWIVAPCGTVEELVEAGFSRPWALVGARPPGRTTGRGPTGRLRSASLGELFVKQYRRGGWLARLNPDTYLGVGRFLRELEVGRRALDAGCPVAPTIALALAPGRLRWRAWAASPLVPGARDLGQVLAEAARGGEGEPAAAAWRGAIEAVARLHDAGLLHADLNLGNLIAAGAPADGANRWRVVDLDRARWLGRPARAAERRAVCRRLERSYRKRFGAGGPVPRRERDAAYLREIER